MGGTSAFPKELVETDGCIVRSWTQMLHGADVCQTPDSAIAKQCCAKGMQTSFLVCFRR